MNQSLFLCARELFPGSDIVRKYTFKAINTRDKSAQIRKKDCFECLPPYHIAA